MGSFMAYLTATLQRANFYLVQDMLLWALRVRESGSALTAGPR